MRSSPQPDAVADQIAEDLLGIGAVTFSPSDPFTWASGLRSPVYCDNRLTLGYPDIRSRIADAFQRVAQRLDPGPDVIAGTATAGIPHAAWLAERMELPMVYVRSAAKAHGRSRQIEGPLAPGRRVVLVEDLVSTGMSSMAAVNALRDVGAHVLAIVAVFSYDLPKARAAVADGGVPLFVLTTFDRLLSAAIRTGSLDEGSADSLRAWHMDPQGWSDSFR